jgi:4-amino-4-deoxy-L-arabinose transferase-like glycosyltransferase
VYSGQAAALAGDPIYRGFFAIFRAHPLLVQFALALVYQLGVNDIAGRLVSVAFGVAAIPLMYALGSLMYGRKAGVIAAAILAFMPYHVIVTRQVLLDGPETTLWLATIYGIARYAVTARPRWLYAAAFAGGMTVLAKETAILVVAVGFAFALMTPTVRLTLRRIVIASAVFVLAIIPYPAAILVGGATGTAQQYFVWQLLRRPNHTGTFYFEVLGGAMGLVLLILVALGVIAAIRLATWQDRLLLAWLLVPFAFFEIWPVKGYQYLLPIAPACALLATRALQAPWSTWLARWTGRLDLDARQLSGARALATIAVPLLLVVTLVVPSVNAVSTTTTQGSLAGTGGLPGAREAGLWVRQNVPAGSTFMTIGPTMSNIIEFYGQRESHGLSVSPNPLRRNPSYDPIINPDRSIQTLKLHYAVWDIWSSSRSTFFASTMGGSFTSSMR